ncbi:MAG: DUF4249 family protein [Saprospiraceae bacterium]|nr:DUF4249 family protein [Saprospiraceae bacterium]
MKNIINFIGILLLIPFFACDEDSFSPLVEIDIPAHTPRLVIRADWQAGSDSLAVFVSKSKGVLDKTKANFSQVFSYWNGKDSIKYVQEHYDTVPNTKVELLRNGLLLGTIPYSRKGYHVANKLYKLDTVSGATYTIRVSAPNFETVEAAQKIQEGFKILRGGYRKDAALYRDLSDPFSSPQRGDELTIEIQDSGNDENYYALNGSGSFGFFRSPDALVSRDSMGQKFEAFGYINNIDPNEENDFLPDRSFNGKNYSWRFWLRPNLDFYSSNGNGNGGISQLKSGDKITVNISSATKDYVLFLKTLDLTASAQDNPFFSEPVILYTNVKNGYGIFTIGSAKSAIIVIP